MYIYLVKVVGCVLYIVILKKKDFIHSLNASMTEGSIISSNMGSRSENSELLLQDAEIEWV